MEERESGGKWQDVLSHLLYAIVAERLSVFDIASCRCVCKSWRSALAYVPKPRVPLLLLLPDEDPACCNLFSLSDRRLRRFNLPHLGPAASRYRYFSSSGCLAALDTSSDVLRIVNPFTGAHLTGCFPRVPCPTVEDSDDYAGFRHCRPDRIRWINKELAADRRLAFFPASSSSGPATATAFLITYPDVLFARIGDQSWTQISAAADRFLRCHGICHHKEQFYAVTHQGAVTAFDLRVSPPRETRFPLPTQLLGEQLHTVEDILPSTYYLAETPDGNTLLLLRRVFILNGLRQDGKVLHLDSEHQDILLRFQVFKLEETDNKGEGKWIEVDNLGPNTALVLGANSSISVCTSNSPYLKENCVYGFNIDKWAVCMVERQLRATGLYNLKDGSTEPLFPVSDRRYDELRELLQPAEGVVPLWFMS